MITRLDDFLEFEAESRTAACAAVFKTERISYGELATASNQLARALKLAGCERGDRVVLLVPKSIEALIGMFGVMKADCIYVPVDVTSPAARIGSVLRQCESRCILAVRCTRAKLAELAASGAVPSSSRIGWLDGTSGDAIPVGIDAAFSAYDLRTLSGATLRPDGEPCPAHILFTSGSTGIPKGVVITHSNVIHFVNWAKSHFGMDTTDRLSCHSPLYFDLSMFDIYGSVAAGAEVHLLPPELSLLPHLLAAYIREAGLTQWFSVPSVLNRMAATGAVREHDFPALRRLLWCGEKIPTPTLIHWMKRLPHVDFTNLYGPTEATVASSFYEIPHCPEDECADIPIGEPCAGEQLWVLDDRLNPVAPGEIGELYISGAGLSPGYWRDPDKTNQVFIANPFTQSLEGWAGAQGNRRLYRTGDLGKVSGDGLFYVLGRIDTQIKSRGYRIELGDIEAAIHAIHGVQHAAVVAIESDGFEGATICCAFAATAGSGLTVQRLSKELSSILPGYMLPQSWLPLASMPLNGNGKLDRTQIKQQFIDKHRGATSRLQVVESAGCI